MAKKSVGIVELHIEKVVLGAAVIFLLVVLVMNLIRNPNVVEFGGEALTPSQIDNAVRERAERLAQSLQRPTEIPGDRLDAPNWAKDLDRTFKEGQIEIHKLGKTMLAVVPWGHPAERIEVKGIRQRREGVALADVEPPSAPKVKYVRTQAVLPHLETRERQEEAAERAELLEQDIDLVTLECEFDLTRQKELIENARYEVELSGITFAMVLVQRQELLGSEWGEWEDVDTVAEYKPPAPPELTMISDSALSSDSSRAFNDYREKLTATNVQRDILTPQGPTLRGQPVYALTDKEARTGARATPVQDRTREAAARLREDRGALQRDISRDYGIQARQPKAATDKEDKKLKFSSDEQARKFIAETLAKAKQAQSAQEFDRAKKLAQQVLDADRLNPGNARREDIRWAETILGRGVDTKDRDLRSEAASGRYQLIRAFDVSGVPGRTYRYRTAVALLNEYCLAPGKLKEAKDATKPVIYGEWSAPSDPVTIERDTYFYLISKDYDGEGVRVAVFKWYRDGWIKENFDVQPGYEIGEPREVQVTIAGRPYLEDVDFFTGAMAVDMSAAAPCELLQNYRDGYRLSSSAQTTQMLVYMDEDGELQTRFAAEDLADPRYRDLQQQTKPVRIKKEKPKTTKEEKKVKRSGQHTSRYGSRSGSRSSRYGRGGSGSRRGSMSGGSRRY